MAAKWWTLVAVCLATFMFLLDVTIVIVALPDIRTAFGADLATVQWTIDAYSLSLAALLLTAGSLADMFGRRRLFVIGLAIFTVGSLLCGLSQSATMLVLCRVVQGVGGATIFATALALLAQTFQGRERGVAFGIWGAVPGISTALGPVLGGVLVSGLGWRWIFLVNLPLGLIAIAIAVTKVGEWRPPHARRLDVPGAAVFTAGLVSLVFGLIEAGRRGWSDTVVLACLVAAALLLAAFPLVERRRKDPLFDLSLFRRPTFVGGSIGSFAINAGLYGTFLYIVLYLTEVQHLSALQSGLRLAIITAANIATAIPAGRLSGPRTARWLVGPGLVIVGIGLLLMRGVDADSSWTHLIAGFIVAGLGSGLVNAPLAATAVGVVPHQSAGMAAGMSNTFRQVGIATAVAAYGAILTAHTSFVSGLDALLLVAALVAIVAGVAAWALIRPRDFVSQGESAAAGDGRRRAAGAGAGRPQDAAGA